jgi:hypothetical protein
MQSENAEHAHSNLFALKASSEIIGFDGLSRAAQVQLIQKNIVPNFVNVQSTICNKKFVM